MKTASKHSNKFRMPSVGVLVGVALVILTMAGLLAWWNATSGIRRVTAIGAQVGVEKNVVSSFVSERVDVDRQHLSTDGDLRHLTLDGPQVDDESMAILLRFRNVRRITMSDCNVTDAGIAELSGLPKLRELFTSNLPITGATIPQLTHLKALSIDNCKTLEPAAVIELSRMPNLNHLSLQRSSMTDESLLGMAGAPALWSLDLTSTGITDASLTYIVHEFPGLKVLIVESLMGITDDGVKKLASLKKLEYLSIRKSNISDETAAFIQKSLPSCIVFHESTFG